MKYKPCDIPRWGKADLWDLLDAAQILVGIEPVSDDSMYPRQANAVLTRLEQSIKLGELRCIRRVGDNAYFFPLQFIDWASRNAYPLPAGLKDEVMAAIRREMGVEKRMRQPTTSAQPGTPASQMIAAPATSPAPQPAPVRHKLRTNSLDAPIVKAIALAGSLETGAVYLELRALALEEEKPFTGITEGDALWYTTDDGTSAKFTKNALRHRLKNHTMKGGGARIRADKRG